MIHDVCLQKLPVVFAVDRAGLVGSDGETHQGIFDLSYLSMIPNMTVLSPKNKWELADMVRFAVRLGAPQQCAIQEAAHLTDSVNTDTDRVWKE